MARAGLIGMAGRKNEFDVAIIGAGYAGLASALLLGRYLVPAVVFDGGAARNSMTRHVHGYPGFENASPRALIGRMQADVKKYSSVTTVRGRVGGVKMRGKYFTVRAGQKVFRAKYIVIATGVQDVKPSAKNFEKFDGDGAWHCPHCDGFEAAGRKLAVIISGKDPLSYTKEFLGWTQDITMFMQGDRLGRAEQNEAAKLEILVVNDAVTRIAGRRGRKPKQLTCASGHRYAADVVFYRLGYRAQTSLAEKLGCELDEGYVKVDGGQQTSVLNVYAAGDVDTDRHFVVLAAAAGARAAVSIHEQLLREAVRQKRNARKNAVN